MIHAKRHLLPGRPPQPRPALTRHPRLLPRTAHLAAALTLGSLLIHSTVSADDASSKNTAAPTAPTTQPTSQPTTAPAARSDTLFPPSDGPADIDLLDLEVPVVVTAAPRSSPPSPTP